MPWFVGERAGHGQLAGWWGFWTWGRGAYLHSLLLRLAGCTHMCDPSPAVVAIHVFSVWVWPGCGGLMCSSSSGQTRVSFRCSPEGEVILVSALMVARDGRFPGHNRASALTPQLLCGVGCGLNQCCAAAHNQATRRGDRRPAIVGGGKGDRGHPSAWAGLHKGGPRLGKRFESIRCWNLSTAWISLPAVSWEEALDLSLARFKNKPRRTGRFIALWGSGSSYGRLLRCTEAHQRSDRINNFDANYRLWHELSGWL